MKNLETRIGATALIAEFKGSLRKGDLAFTSLKNNAKCFQNGGKISLSSWR